MNLLKNSKPQINEAKIPKHKKNYLTRFSIFEKSKV